MTIPLGIFNPAQAAFLLGIAAVLGACLGSFVNCLAWRLANGESVYTYPVVLETGETSTLSTKLGGVYTDTVVRYEPDTTAGYYVFTTAANDPAIENGFVVTSTDGLAISVKRGISGVATSFTAAKSIAIWNATAR